MVDVNEERELEESLHYMREQFHSLSQNIKLPDSLKADVLKKRLELMELEQDKGQETQSRVLKFPWRPVVGAAACFAVVVGSYFALHGNSGGITADDLSMDAPMSSMESAGGAAPSAFAAQASPTMEMDGAPVGEAAPEEETPAPLMARGAAVPEFDSPVSEGGDTPAQMAAVEELETLEAACSVGNWGSYLPTDGLGDMTFYSGTKDDNQLSVSYLNTNYSRELRVYVSDYNEETMKLRLADLLKPETYDMTLYKSPYFDTVPEALYEVFFSPIFRLADLTEAIVKSRVLVSQETGDSQPTGNFSVLYEGSVLVEYNVHGVTAEELYQIIEVTAQK